MQGVPLHDRSLIAASPFMALIIPPGKQPFCEPQHYGRYNQRPFWTDAWEQ